MQSLLYNYEVILTHDGPGVGSYNRLIKVIIVLRIIRGRMLQCN